MTPPATSWAIGVLAGTLTTLSFVPQVVKSWRNRSVSDLSLVMLIVFATGVCLWIVYGVLVGAAPVIVSNAVTGVLALMLLGMKLRFRQRERPRSPTVD